MRFPKNLLFTALVVFVFISGCGQATFNPPQATQPATLPPTRLPATLTATPLPSATATQRPTATSMPSATPTETLPPTPTSTFTPTPSPTPDENLAVAQMRAFCRYGPGQAYLYSHELKEGDPVTLDGRSGSGNWLWVQPHNLNRHCWAAASVLSLSGDVSSLPVVQSSLPEANNLYTPPQGVGAARDGDTVIVNWEPVWMTEDDDRGYLVEATVCQGGELVTVSIQTNSPGVTLTDEEGCEGGSSGRVYTVEKHGYTSPVEIPWP